MSEAWRAMDQVYSAVFETPLEPSPWLSQQSEGTTVRIKWESKQATGGGGGGGGGIKKGTWAIFPEL